MINWPKVNAVVAHLEEHPEEHAQALWGFKTECGTTACMAGRTTLMFAPEKVEWDTDGDGVAYLTTVDALARNFVSIPELAAAELGLSAEDARALFYWASDLDDIKTYLARIRAREACDA